MMHADGAIFEVREPVSNPLTRCSGRVNKKMAPPRTQRVFDTDRCIHWLFEEQVARSPNAIAIDDGRETISYAELNIKANRVAHYLRSREIGRGALIGVCMRRSIDLIAAVMAVLKCGAAYVPMEPAWPDERIRKMTEALALAGTIVDAPGLARSLRWSEGTSARHIIVSLEENQTIKAVLSEAGIKLVETTRRLEGLADTNPLRETSADDRAYVIFTSGSSGQPKGVVVRHRPVINLFDWVNGTFAVGEGDRILFSTSIAFDLSVYDIFGILAAGGTIRLASNEELADPRQMARILQSENITFWDSAPAALERLMPFLSLGPTPALRLVFLSGDWIPLSLPPAVRKIFPEARVIALGGATEATVWSNFYEAKQIDPAWVSIPYGRPIQNVQYHILDECLIPCAVGVPGDLYIGGDCLADGYANDSDLTARKFIADPFHPGARLYRTGDRARWHADGNIEFLGRADRQVKIRGFRVEPIEIEAVLERHPDVRRAVVLAEGELRGTKRLVSHVLLRESAGAGKAVASALRAFLRSQLPDYMVPSRVNILHHLPVTANGKVDYAAFANATHSNEDRGDSGKPKTKRQRALVDIWQRVLGLQHVGIHDNFFELGGDSLQSVQMIVAAAGAGIQLRINDLHENPTVAQIAALNASTCIIHVRHEGTGDIPLTPTQQWFFSRQLKFPERYNSVHVFDVSRRLSVQHLSTAIDHLSKHHDALRLRFVRQSGRLVQLISHQPGDVVCEWDISQLDPESRASEIDQRVRDARCRLNIENGQLISVILLNKGVHCPQQLLLVLHHLVFDAVSLRILIEDLTTVCNQLEHEQALLIPTTMPFSRWAQRTAERRASASSGNDRQPEEGGRASEVQPLPLDHPDGKNRYRTAGTVSARLSKRVVCELNECARRNGISLADFLLAACAQVLSRWSNHPTILIDLTDHGRRDLLDDASFARTVGYITANVPLVVDVPADGSLQRLAQQTRQQRSKIGGKQSASRQQIRISPEVKFNFIGSMTSQDLDTGRFRSVATSFAGVMDMDDERAYLFNLELFLAGGQLYIEWKFNEAIHDCSTIRHLIERYTRSLRQLIVRNGQQVSTIGATAIERSGR